MRPAALSPCEAVLWARQTLSFSVRIWIRFTLDLIHRKLAFIHSYTQKYFLLRLKRVPGPVLGAESGIWADSPSGRYCPSGLHPKAGPWLGFKPLPLSLQARSCPGGGAGSPKRERFRCVWPERWLPGFLS